MAISMLAPACSWASDATRPFAAPAARDATGATAGGVLEITIALLVVLAAIFGFAWLARRARVLAGGARGRIDVVAELSVGVKERVLLVRVRDVEILLGVAPGRVATLHSFPTINTEAELQESATPGSSPSAPSFAELLRKSLGR
jgi:flagellar protein FliO/FliZ